MKKNNFSKPIAELQTQVDEWITELVLDILMN